MDRLANAQRDFEVDGRDYDGATERVMGRRGMLQARIGLVPLPYYLALLAVLAVAVTMPGRLDLVSGLLLPVVGGFTLAELGQRIPLLRKTGLDTVLVLLVPSWLASAGLLPEDGVTALRRLIQATDAIGLFVTILVVGSVMSLERAALPADMMRLVAMLAFGTMAALGGGIAAAALIGREVVETVVLTLAPTMAGGLSLGAFPMSAAYAEALGASQGALLARMLPPMITANLLAILLAGAVFSLERRHDDGDGPASPLPEPPKPAGQESHGHLALAFAGLVALHVASSHIARSSGSAAPLIVLLASVLLRLFDPWLAGPRQDVVLLYRGCLRALIHPVLFIAGMLFIPWGLLVEGFTSIDLLPVAAAVGGMVLAGAALARPLGLSVADGAVLALSRVAMGGTGTIAILSASHRLRLMPQAQILTRIGGAITLAAAMAGISAFDP